MFFYPVAIGKQCFLHLEEFRVMLHYARQSESLDAEESAFSIVEEFHPHWTVEIDMKTLILQDDLMNLNGKIV